MSLTATTESRQALSPRELSALSQRIKEQAKHLGFEKVGIVPAASLSRERSQLLAWLERGYHGSMSWLARDPELRSDPRRLFPAARSVIVVGLNYYTPHKHNEDHEISTTNPLYLWERLGEGAQHRGWVSEADAGTGKVSRYAWGDDYHDVVGAKLRSLLQWIQEEIPEVEGKVCVDIQPMMDKAWAVRAGLGWLGKHTNVITPEFGSWVFLGELLLNIELDYETQFVADHCGTCTLCIDACPTDAITEPYIVDSNKCISYATIELREPEIPAAIADKLEGWFYGCDICQDVCPWNRFEQTTSEPRFQPRDGNVDASLADVVNMTHADYVERFRGSAMKRAKLSGLQRNARTLLENSIGRFD
ncbi:MAG TPA: tRNA epoxyqueuosine(34) reductase QueG [Pyrinomonadaceae bacterium]|nr:tRNA epoxyqueuosine(34) reductase QueG [Pyrinomonadaceae bacterium]